MKLAIGLLIIFIPNLIFSLFFTFGESFSTHIAPILISIVAITWAIYRIRKHRKEIKQWRNSG
jgi:hypothetical protein